MRCWSGVSLGEGTEKVSRRQGVKYRAWKAERVENMGGAEDILATEIMARPLALFQNLACDGTSRSAAGSAWKVKLGCGMSDVLTQPPASQLAQAAQQGQALQLLRAFGAEFHGPLQFALYKSDSQLVHSRHE